MYTPTAQNQRLSIPRNYSQNNHRHSIGFSDAVSDICDQAHTIAERDRHHNQLSRSKCNYILYILGYIYMLLI